MRVANAINRKGATTVPDLREQPYRHLLVTYLAPRRRQVAVLAALLTASVALNLASPQITSPHDLLYT